MKAKTILLIILLFHTTYIFSQIPIYRNPNIGINERVKDLISRMTVEEKVYQMCCLRIGEGDEIFKTSGKYSSDFIISQFGDHGIGNLSCPTTDMNNYNSLKTNNEIQNIAKENTRLGIPVIINDEALHGIKGKGAISYPQAIAMSCTWDLNLMNKIGESIGFEAHCRGIHQVLSPVLDLARDPRHGRMEETYGEDPLLAGLMGKEFILGVQKNNVICTPKHFVANFAGQGGRDSENISISERELREIYLKPFEIAIKGGGAKSLMASYNAIDGIPNHANRWLLTDILRDEWRFNGFTVSDWSAIPHLCTNHLVAKNFEDAAIMASKAGMDVELPRLKAYRTLIDAIKTGKISESSIDKNVSRILQVKFELGLFDNPYISKDLALKNNRFSKFKELALEAANKSIVLLKNENNILPLNKFNTIAVIGPNANKLQLGGYSSTGVNGLTPFEAISKEMSNKKILYSKGCDLKGNDKSGFTNAIKTAKESDACILIMGGQYGETGGETSDRISLRLMGVQEELIKEISSLNKPIIVVLIDGRPVEMTEWMNKVNGIFMMFFNGERGSEALAKVISGKVNPSGKLTITYPKYTGQLPMPLLNRPYGREGNFVDNPLNKDNFFVYKHRYNPLYPFGYGLSYSNFKYSNIQISQNRLYKNDSLLVSIDITNDSMIDGEEIVELYLSSKNCRISPYPLVLNDFKRVYIPKGKTQKVNFQISYKEFAFLNEKFKNEVNRGNYNIFIGKNCLDGLSSQVELCEDIIY